MRRERRMAEQLPIVRRKPHVAEQFSVLPASTFVVRFWQEWTGAGSRWRGWIEHVQSGRSAVFLDPDDMLEFVRSYGVMAEEENRAPGRGNDTG